MLTTRQTRSRIQAKTDLVTGYNNAAGQARDADSSSELGGQTLVAGVYGTDSSLGLTGTVTLDGGGRTDGVWVFQVGSTLTTASSSSVSLTNGAQACNVYWQIGSSATLGTEYELRRYGDGAGGHHGEHRGDDRGPPAGSN